MSANLVQTGLTIEQHDISIDNMPLDNIPNRQTLRNLIPISYSQVLLERAGVIGNVVRSRVNVHSIAYSLLQPLDVESSNSFGVCEHFRDTFWDGDFVDAKVGVRTDDSTAGEVDSFAGQVSSEPTLFSLQALDKAADGLLAWLRR